MSKDKKLSSGRQLALARAQSELIQKFNAERAAEPQPDVSWEARRRRLISRRPVLGRLFVTAETAVTIIPAILLVAGMLAFYVAVRTPPHLGGFRDIAKVFAWISDHLRF